MIPTHSEKKTRARKLLKRLLSDSQWKEFERYKSFREDFCGRDGLPMRRVEFGEGFHGWLEFKTNNWDVPDFFRVTELSGEGYWDGWVVEDSIITNLLTVRLNSEQVLDPNWACTNHVGWDDANRLLIMKREFHLKKTAS